MEYSNRPSYNVEDFVTVDASRRTQAQKDLAAPRAAERLLPFRLPPVTSEIPRGSGDRVLSFPNPHNPSRGAMFYFIFIFLPSRPYQSE